MSWGAMGAGAVFAIVAPSERVDRRFRAFLWGTWIANIIMLALAYLVANPPGLP